MSSIKEIKNIFVRYNGVSYEVDYAELDIGDTIQENRVKRAVERHLEMEDHALKDYVMDLYPSAIVLRPEAQFG
jgi:hypothetical protein